jgi:hypothetical protein
MGGGCSLSHSNRGNLADAGLAAISVKSVDAMLAVILS